MFDIWTAVDALETSMDREKVVCDVRHWEAYLSLLTGLNPEVLPADTHLYYTVGMQTPAFGIGTDRHEGDLYAGTFEFLVFENGYDLVLNGCYGSIGTGENNALEYSRVGRYDPDNPYWNFHLLNTILKQVKDPWLHLPWTGSRSLGGI